MKSSMRASLFIVGSTVLLITFLNFILKLFFVKANMLEHQLFVSILVALIGAASIIFLRVHVSKPIQILSESVDKLDINNKNLSRITVAMRSEFSIVANAINGLIDRITSQREALIMSESRAQMAQEIANVGNWELDLNTKQIWASKQSFLIYGLPYESNLLPLELVQNQVIHQDRVKLDVALAQLISGQSIYNIEFEIIRKVDGALRFINSKAEIIRDANNYPIKVLGVILDITERKEHDKIIMHNYYHDGLTELYNRRFFDEEIDRLELVDIPDTSIIVADINGLKLSNDLYGHEFGDQIIMKVTEILVSECGKETIVARVGGDEFAILLTEQDYDKTHNLVDRLKKRLDDESQDEMILSVSFGTAACCEEVLSLRGCYNLAEDRMYTSKLLEGKSAKSKMINNLRVVLEERTGETQAHCDRISEMSKNIALELKMHDFEIEHLRLLSLLHDIGKSAIPDDILMKPGKLTESEMDVMKKHSEIGFRIANSMPELLPISEGILHHHERWDGTGYPMKLAGKDIPKIARIICVLDAFDAMTNDRPYQKARSVAEAIEEIKKCSGTQFDPSIVEIFLKIVNI